MFWIGVAVLIHVVVIGVTSLGYIRDRWIDPEGALRRKEVAAAAVEAEKARLKPPAKAEPIQAAPAGMGSTNPTKTVPSAAVVGAGVSPFPATNAVGSVPGDEAAQLASRRNTTVVRRITEPAASNAIPTKPDLGISLEDTSLR
jgi:hypothetical protein